MSVDNRGSWGRGKDFVTAISRKMGTIEIDDQREAVEHFVKKGFVDPKRVGIMGHSMVAT